MELNICFTSPVIITNLIEKLLFSAQIKLKRKKAIINLTNKLDIKLYFVMQGSKISIILVKIFT